MNNRQRAASLSPARITPSALPAKPAGAAPLLGSSAPDEIAV
jgi:hypothetical protein